MNDNPYTPPDDSTKPPSIRVPPALQLFVGVWLIGTGFTMLFSQMRPNPVEPLTDLIPVRLIPLVTAPFAGSVTFVWSVIPTSRFEFVNETIFAGTIILGGLFTPHVLSIIADLIG